MDTKPWYTSTTIWGSIIAITAPLIGAIFHVNISTESAAIADALAGIGGAIGGLIAVYGRVKATTSIGAKQ
jgi:hypothetical protein